MGRITSNVGLVSGLPIAEIVDQLMEIAAIPRDTLIDRTKDLQSQQLAISSLSSKLLGLKFDLGKLDSSSLFESKKATSSDPALLLAAITDSTKAAKGNYRFTPIRTATSHQLVSQRFDGPEATFSAQSFSFRKGGFVDRGRSLDELNDGLGVRTGDVRITDKAGSTAIIDLRFVTSIDDVIQAINSNSAVNVTAAVDGDAFKLTDHTGQSGTLSVQEVNGGSTAADLGLADLTAAGATTSATGDDIFGLHAGTRLTKLNDGNGVSVDPSQEGVDDLVFTLADESGPVGVDLSTARTLGEVIDAINSAEGLAGKVEAAIAADGNRLELTDLTAGAGTFSVSNGTLGSVADELGLTTTASGGTITGRRLTSGLRDTLLSSVNGGQGIETLGDLEITNRDGVLSTVDLSNVETLNEVVDAINDSAVGVVAAINTGRNGIALTDTTGGTSSNLIVSSSGAATVAEDLGIVFDGAADSIDSGSLKRQTMSRATLLSSIRGGQGVGKIGDISITNTDGVTKAIDLNSEGSVPTTVGHVIDAINAASAGVEARLNDNGDGIILIDTADGAGDITVRDMSGTLAKHLNLARSSVEQEVSGTPTKVIDGTAVTTVSIEDGDTLADLVAKINEASSGVTASLLTEGNGTRLSLAVGESGAANALQLDLGDDFLFQEISAAQDALLKVGDSNSSSGGILVSSSTNEFENVVGGLSLTVVGSSDQAVDIAVAASDASLVSAVEQFVEAYNSVRSELGTLTDFDEEDLSTGLLFGTNEALRVDTQLARLATDRFPGLGAFESLSGIGIRVNSDGLLELDAAQLQAAFAEDPEGLENLFADSSRGVVARFDSVIDQLAGETGSLLNNRDRALQSTIDSNEARIAQIEGSLERQRESLLLQYAQLEKIIANFQEAQTALSAFQPVPPMTSRSAN